MISIGDLPKELVAVELWKAARPLVDQLMIDGKLTIEEAKERLARGETFFDIVHGRSMKVELARDSFDEWFYDRDNGQGTARKVCYDLDQGILLRQAANILFGRR